MKNASSSPAIDIVHFADPWCSWSWSLEPILNRLKAVYGDQIKISYKMGGITEDFGDWRQHYNAVTDPELIKWFTEAFQEGKMPFDIGYVLKTKVKTTYPACIAFKVAQMQGENLAHKFLRRLMETNMLECRNGSEEAVYLRVAKETGLDAGKLKKDAKSSKCKKLFLRDKAQMNVNFLTLAIVDSKTRKGLAVGEVFDSAHAYEHAIENLTKGKLKKHVPKDIYGYFKEHESELIPAHEIAVVFDMTEKKAAKSLDALVKKKLLKKRQFDFADFWTLKD